MQHLTVYLFIARSLHMFRVPSHTSSGLHKTLTTASGTGHVIGAAASFQRDQLATLE